MYRQNPAGGQPITIPVASYDIVSPTRTLAAESELAFFFGYLSGAEACANRVRISRILQLTGKSLHSFL